jgi:hypothetical protein
VELDVSVGLHDLGNDARAAQERLCVDDLDDLEVGAHSHGGHNTATALPPYHSLRDVELALPETMAVGDPRRTSSTW